jgi:hypothetical protein
MLFIYKRKKSGPRIEPWGTLNFISVQLDEPFTELLVPRFTLWYLPSRYDSSSSSSSSSSSLFP